MPKCKILMGCSICVLEDKINDFIADKNVIDISITTNKWANYCACITYEEWNEV